MLFRPVISTSHPLDGIPLAYVHWFTRPTARIEEPIHMFAVKRLRRGDMTPCTGIIEVDSISRFIQLIPKFPSSTRALQNIDADYLMDNNDTFLINSFTDMEVYQAVY